MMRVVVTTGAIRRAKFPDVNRHRQQTDAMRFTGRMPFLSPNQQRQSTERKSITFPGLTHLKLTWGSSNLILDR